MAPGTIFSLGGEVDLVLADDTPPVASARHAKTGVIRFATDGMLVLPDEDRPEVSIFEDAIGRWVAEHGDETRVVRANEVVVADGDGWIVDLPTTAGPTWEASAFAPTLESITLSFAVSRDEEHIEVTVLHSGKAEKLPPRSHHYLLLTLARARIDDPSSSPGERGWVDRDELCRMLATEPGMLNVDVFRARRQLAEMGVHGAAGIVARRPGTGQLRLGTDRVVVGKL
ncbi:FHA domain protein [Minicystis rosea]|nr:FHA domain protein [Minicystis rosea]